MTWILLLSPLATALVTGLAKKAISPHKWSLNVLATRLTG